MLRGKVPLDRFEQQLYKYADLLIKVGVNLQPAQVLCLESPIETPEFTRIVVRKAYEAGAKFVQVVWVDETISRIRFESAPDDSFTYYPQWTASTMEQLCESGGALLSLLADDPDLLNGIDSGKISTAAKAASMARQKFRSYIRTNKISWCLANVPTRAWADKVFADFPESDRVQALWDILFKINRIDHDDPVVSWQNHIQSLQNLSGLLNEKRYKKLHYKGPGTALTVELVQDHVWVGGGGWNQDGVYFVANMPTEEVFTMPHRSGTNGYVSSTMPLNYNGGLIDGFTLTFKDGQVVDYTAKVGYESLKELLESDEGAKYLGEVALVPQDSPISNLNRVFYDTGLDENASCHLAIGSAYPFNVQEGTQLSKEELEARGANMSMTHVDFMIGSTSLDIDGELANGTTEPLFRQGNWVIATA